VRRLFKLPLLLVLGIVGMALVGPWGAAEALAGATAQASGACSPVITSWSTFEAAQDPAFTVKGTCFGTGGQFPPPIVPRSGLRRSLPARPSPR
jgi:hypothetical protein